MKQNTEAPYRRSSGRRRKTRPGRMGTRPGGQARATRGPAGTCLLLTERPCLDEEVMERIRGSRGEVVPKPRQRPRIRRRENRRWELDAGRGLSLLVASSEEATPSPAPLEQRPARSAPPPLYLHTYIIYATSFAKSRPLCPFFLHSSIVFPRA